MLYSSTGQLNPLQMVTQGLHAAYCIITFIPSCLLHERQGQYIHVIFSDHMLILLTFLCLKISLILLYHRPTRGMGNIIELCAQE